MTVPLSADSPRRPAAVAFGRALGVAMTRRGIGKRTLMEAAGTGNTSAMSAWKAGRNLPTFATALKLAEALQAPRLAEIVRDARTITCAVCQGQFVYEGGRPDRTRFCGNECQTYEAMRKRDGYGRLVPGVVELHLGRARAAIRRFCLDCEPDGACRTAECPLRRVSPLPLVERADVAVAVSRLDNKNSPTAALKRVASLRAGWARTPDRHLRQSAEQRARWAAKTPEERAGFAQRISESRRRGIAERRGATA